MSPNSDDQNNKSQDYQQDDQQISTGGFTPEVASSPSTSAESSSEGESGYEQIKKIEQQAELQEQKEKFQRQAEQQKQKSAQQSKQKREKKEVPDSVKPKYFGYNPPPQLMNDPEMIKKQAGKGDKKESKTWLLMFLDRVLKKESEG